MLGFIRGQGLGGKGGGRQDVDGQCVAEMGQHYWLVDLCVLRFIRGRGPRARGQGAGCEAGQQSIGKRRLNEASTVKVPLTVCATPLQTGTEKPGGEPTNPPTDLPLPPPPPPPRPKNTQIKSYHPRQSCILTHRVRCADAAPHRNQERFNHRMAAQPVADQLVHPHIQSPEDQLCHRPHVSLPAAVQLAAGVDCALGGQGGGLVQGWCAGVVAGGVGSQLDGNWLKGDILTGSIPVCSKEGEELKGEGVLCEGVLSRCVFGGRVGGTREEEKHRGRVEGFVYPSPEP